MLQASEVAGIHNNRICSNNNTLRSWVGSVQEKKDTKYNPARNPYITQDYNACIDEILGGGE